MKRHFDAPIVVLIIAVLLEHLSPIMPAAWLPWVLLVSKAIFGLGLLGLVVKCVDWWGEDAPVFHPHRYGKLVQLNYREAQVRMRLIKLLNGDARMARRQVRIIKARYPGQPEQWCWERAIADLENRLAR